MPLGEMNSTSIQTNPHHVYLQTCSACVLVLQVLLYRPASCDNQNTVVMVATTVLSHAALGTTLGLTPARPLSTPYFAIYCITATEIDVTEVHIVPDFQDA